MPDDPFTISIPMAANGTVRALHAALQRLAARQQAGQDALLFASEGVIACRFRRLCRKARQDRRRGLRRR